MQDKIERVLFTEAQLAQRVREMGEAISRDYERLLGERIASEPPLAIGLLRGAVIFLADLARALHIPVELAFMAISSYGLSTSPGEVRTVKDLEIPVAGRHILIVEDIVDTGQTLLHLKELLAARHPAGVKVCALIDKTPRRARSVSIDYIGFTVSEDAFLIGYGLDYAERYRNLPYIAALSRSAIRP